MKALHGWFKESKTQEETSGAPSEKDNAAARPPQSPVSKNNTNVTEAPRPDDDEIRDNGRHKLSMKKVISEKISQSQDVCKQLKALIRHHKQRNIDEESRGVELSQQ